MDYLKRANELMTEMENLLSKNYLSTNENEKLGELYKEVKRNLEEASHTIIGKNIDNLNKARKRFKKICAEFEMPEDINEITKNNMFPNEGSMEGFDWTFED
jgi:hypothetical protein